MARLSLSLLGPLHAERAGARIRGFESNKVRALLAYLAVEADRPHRASRWLRSGGPIGRTGRHAKICDSFIRDSLLARQQRMPRGNRAQVVAVG